MEQVISRTVARVASQLGDNWEVSVTIVDDPTIHELNREHRGMDKPTDVLSFSQLETVAGAPAEPNVEGEPVLLGDIVISLERAQAQADEYGHSLAREVGFLTAHGTLHLLGFDHQTPEEEAEMTAHTEAVLASLGLTR
jgi:probable rRNA maturation factor